MAIYFAKLSERHAAMTVTERHIYEYIKDTFDCSIVSYDYIDMIKEGIGRACERYLSVYKAAKPVSITRKDSATTDSVFLSAGTVRLTFTKVRKELY